MRSASGDYEDENFKDQKKWEESQPFEEIVVWKYDNPDLNGKIVNNGLIKGADIRNKIKYKMIRLIEKSELFEQGNKQIVSRIPITILNYFHEYRLIRKQSTLLKFKQDDECVMQTLIWAIETYSQNDHEKKKICLDKLKNWSEITDKRNSSFIISVLETLKIPMIILFHEEYNVYYKVIVYTGHGKPIGALLITNQYKHVAPINPSFFEFIMKKIANNYLGIDLAVRLRDKDFFDLFQVIRRKPDINLKDAVNLLIQYDKIADRHLKSGTNQ